LEQAAAEIEQSLQNEMDREIPTSRVGELVMEKLKNIDEVAYVRFASVYRQFKDLNTFLAELTRLLEEK
jgi:transcriptional repressor NrdR